MPLPVQVKLCWSDSRLRHGCRAADNCSLLMLGMTLRVFPLPDGARVAISITPSFLGGGGWFGWGGDACVALVLFLGRPHSPRRRKRPRPYGLSAHPFPYELYTIRLPSLSFLQDASPCDERGGQSGRALPATC